MITNSLRPVSQLDFGFVNEDGKRFLEAGEYHILVQGQTVKIELID